MLGWALLGVGASIMIVWGLVGLFGLVKYGTPIITDGATPKWLNWMEADIQSAWLIVHDHPMLEMIWWIGQHVVILLFGFLILRLGMRALWPHKFNGSRKAAVVPGFGYLSRGVLAFAKGFSGCVALIVTTVGFYTLRSCATVWHGDAPSWLTGTLISYRYTDSCQAFSQKVDWGAFSFAVFFVALLVVSIDWLLAAVVEVRAALDNMAASSQ